MVDGRKARSTPPASCHEPPCLFLSRLAPPGRVACLQSIDRLRRNESAILTKNTRIPAAEI
jgi:hypothetical protein